MRSAIKEFRYPMCSAVTFVHCVFLSSVLRCSLRYLSSVFLYPVCSDTQCARLVSCYFTYPMSSEIQSVQIFIVLNSPMSYLSSMIGHPVFSAIQCFQLSSVLSYSVCSSGSRVYLFRSLILIYNVLRQDILCLAIQ